MKRNFIAAIFICAILFSANNVLAQAQIGTANDLHFTYEEMRVFKTHDDFVNNNYILADAIRGKSFKKDKDKVADKDECWGYSVTDNDSTYTYRICAKWGLGDLLMAMRGSLCMYCDGAPYVKPKTKQLFILFYQFTEPCYFSVGDTGAVQKFNRQNISEAVKDDGTLKAQTEGIKNVSSNGQEYIMSRVHLVQAYNKRHPTDENEFDLWSPPVHHAQKKQPTH